MLSRWLTRSRSRGGGDDADFVSIESSEEKTVEITDLTPETSYKLTAIAYNADQRPSNPATATFTTPEKPTTPDPDKATISIEEVKATYNSVTFTLKTANAARFGYKVDVPDGTAELTFVNGSEGGTYTTDNLEAATDYQITAVAYDENGQAADPVTHAFKTEALPTGPAVVSIEEVATTHSSIRFTLKLDNAVRIAYKVDVPDGTAEMTVVEKPQQSTFLVGSLQAETDYVLTVVAYNGKDEPSEPATHSFTTPAYTAFARIDAVATAHGIYLKADVDTGKFPLYFLKIFDPDLTESSADFEEHFKVDSREQFIHYLEVASLTAGLKTASFEEWNKTLLSTRSQQVLLYAAPVVRQGVDVVCEDYGEIIEIPLTIPARDELGAGQAAVTLGEPQVAGKELEIALTKQDGVVSYYAGYATKSDYTCYKYNPGTSLWLSYTGYNIQQIVKSDTWDIVCLQEHTGNSCGWIWNDTEKNAIQGLIADIRADQNGHTPKFVYIMSQAYFNMDKIGTAQRPYKNFTTQDEMFDVIVAQARKVLDQTDVEQIIPTGTVLQNLRTSPLNNDMDLTRDGYHMDYGLSRYAAACAVFESIISPSFDGKKLDGNSFRYNVSSTADGTYTTPVTDDNQPVALQAARYALATPFAVTDMSPGTQTPGNGIEDTDFENDSNKE